MFKQGKFSSMSSIVLVSLVLTACGGGGDDGGTQARVVIPNTPGQINSDNAQSVATEVADQFSDGFGASFPFDPVALATQGAGAIAPFSTATGVRSQQAVAAITQNNVTPAAIEDCPDGGTIEDTQSGNQYTIAANDCTMIDNSFGSDETVVINGRIVSTVTTDTIAQCPGAFVAQSTVQSFSVATTFGDISETTTMSGGFDMDITSSNNSGDANCETLDVLMSSDGFSFGGTMAEATIDNMTTEGTINTDTNDYSYTYQALFPSLAANGMLSIVTLEPIVGNEYAYPSSGTIEVSSNGQTITIIINSSISTDPDAVSVVYNGVTTNYSWIDIVYGEIEEAPAPIAN
jgi:hypothetical protein